MRLPKTLFMSVFPPVFAILILALASATWFAAEAMRDFHRQEVTTTIQIRARLIERDINSLFKKPDPAGINALCREFGDLTGSRITAVLPTGDVVGDSQEDPAVMDNHADRPEVMEAMAGGVGEEIRYSHTLHSNSVYVAIPVRAAETGSIIGILRVSESLAAVDHALDQLYAKAAAGTAVVAALAAVVIFLLARHATRPLKRMVRETRLLADSQFSPHIHVPSSVELAELANAMNQMADQLRERIETITHQRSELDAVLGSMTEGVLAIDMNERILTLNSATARMLQINQAGARGRNVQEVLRNPRFLSSIERMYQTFEPFEEEFILSGVPERHIHLSASGLRADNGRQLGILFVLQDITNQRRLERARSDFIANVTHELKTPVTSIKGYAETLLTDGKDDPETLNRFLEIIARQADRLSALVDDTLSLTSLERSETECDVVFEPLRALDLLEAARNVCAQKAAASNIDIVLDCPEEIVIRGNEVLLERALVNLLDNAIKHSTPNSQIQILVHQQDAQTAISVKDTGCGIEAQHLSRIFERFYRVDSARTRKMGGTGLGLAIVKHIASLHNGTVTVESVPSKGSCFTLHLPA